MHQLSLFDAVPTEKPAILAERSQLQLFEQGTLELARASEYLRVGDIEAAHGAFRLLAAKWSLDPVLNEQARLVSDVFRRYTALLQLAPQSQSLALLRFAREMQSWSLPSGAFHDCCREWIRRSVRQWCVVVHDGELIEGRLPGEWFDIAESFDEACASFERAKLKRYDVRIAARWGDALAKLGQTGLARYRYRDALLMNPFDVAMTDIRDDAVRSLPDVVRYEIGIDVEPAAWSAPVGIVRGILPRPTAADFPLANGALGQTRYETLERAREFTRMLVRLAQPEIRKDAAALIDVRRTMKKVCPELFAVVLHGGT